MDRTEFAAILNSIQIPEGCDVETLQRTVKPISHALVEMMPDKLFRYRNCSEMSVEAFENDKVYALTADMFNDPYDMLLRFDIETVKNMFNSLLSNESFYRLKDVLGKGKTLPDIVKQNFDQENISQIKNIVLSITNDSEIDSFVSNRRNEVMDMVDLYFPLLATFVNKRTATISCFSETIKSVTMWSHYADYHKGFVLEYDLRPTLSNGIPNVGIYPVIYDDKRYDGTQYILWEFLRMLGVKLPNPDTLSYIKCALHKSSQWEYEKEWRLIDSNLRDNIISENKTWVSLKPTAIYYGTNISSDNKNRLHSIAQGKNLKEYNMYIDYAFDKYEMQYRECV